MIKQSSEGKADSSTTGRRQFLIKGSAVALGALVLGTSSRRAVAASPASPILGSYFLWLTEQFAANVGFSLQQESAATYIQQAYGVQSEAWRQYQRPLAKNYSYESTWGYYWSQQYYNARPSYMLYPWAGNGNSLLTFQSLTNRNYYSNYLAGPSIWGLKQASIYVVKHRIMSTTYEVSQALLPECDCQSSWSQGRFQDSYRQPDTYTSFDGSRVSVDYQRVTNDRGEVKVEYRNPKNGDRDFEFVEAVPLSAT